MLVTEIYFSFLNGVKLDKIVRIKTLFCKAASVIFTVASGTITIAGGLYLYL